MMSRFCEQLGETVSIEPNTKSEPVVLKSVFLCMLMLISSMVTGYTTDHQLSLSEEETRIHETASSTSNTFTSQGNDSFGWGGSLDVPNYNLPESGMTFTVDTNGNTVISIEGTNSISINGTTYSNSGGSYNTCFILSYNKSMVLNFAYALYSTAGASCESIDTDDTDIIIAASWSNNQTSVIYSLNESGSLNWMTTLGSTYSACLRASSQRAYIGPVRFTCPSRL